MAAGGLALMVVPQLVGRARLAGAVLDGPRARARGRAPRARGPATRAGGHAHDARGAGGASSAIGGCGRSPPCRWRRSASAVVAGNWVVTLLEHEGHGRSISGVVGGLVLFAGVVTRPAGGLAVRATASRARGRSSRLQLCRRLRRASSCSRPRRRSGSPRSPRSRPASPRASRSQPCSTSRCACAPTPRGGGRARQRLRRARDPRLHAARRAHLRAARRRPARVPRDRPRVWPPRSSAAAGRAAVRRSGRRLAGAAAPRRERHGPQLRRHRPARSALPAPRRADGARRRATGSRSAGPTTRTSSGRTRSRPDARRRRRRRR